MTKWKDSAQYNVFRPRKGFQLDEVLSEDQKRYRKKALQRHLTLILYIEMYEAYSPRYRYDNA